jgi:GDP/UDP-N,N'-diacetylbacillosamine 2-epimerase (hydrolysing)
MKKKILVVTGTRAEYGLLKLLLNKINASTSFELQLIVTGTHLSKAHGFTVSEIESDGYKITKKIDLMLSGDQKLDIVNSMSLALTDFAKAMDQLLPDLVLVLGDRFEILMAASAAMITGKPIAHIHGGEVTSGAFDDSIRHSITKMSHLHFVSTNSYQARVVQLGEHPSTVFDVGSLGVEGLNNLDLLDKRALEETIGFRLEKNNFLVTYHPVTIDKDYEMKNIANLFQAIKEVKNAKFIFTLPNSDPGNLEISMMIKSFCSQNQSSEHFDSLGQFLYLSCMRHMSGVIGNSSSGIIEAPSFKIGTINIGNRQQGREFPPSVLHCKMNKMQIKKAIKEIVSDDFQRKIENIKNPYDHGDTSTKIVEILTKHKNNFDILMHKNFYDLSDNMVNQNEHSSEK